VKAAITCAPITAAIKARQSGRAAPPGGERGFRNPPFAAAGVIPDQGMAFDAIGDLNVIVIAIDGLDAWVENDIGHGDANAVPSQQNPARISGIVYELTTAFAGSTPRRRRMFDPGMRSSDTTKPDVVI
jgi:hypothetical protein